MPQRHRDSHDYGDGREREPPHRGEGLGTKAHGVFRNSAEVEHKSGVLIHCATNHILQDPEFQEVRVKFLLLLRVFLVYYLMNYLFF